MFELKAFVNILFRPKTKYMPNFNFLTILERSRFSDE